MARTLGASPAPFYHASRRTSRLDCRRQARGATPKDTWKRYAERLDGFSSRVDRFERTVSFFAERPPRDSATRAFGCFSYELLDADRVVRIHLGNRAGAEGLWATGAGQG